MLHYIYIGHLYIFFLLDTQPFFFFFFFFFNDTATTEIYTLSLHDALPILIARDWLRVCQFLQAHMCTLESRETVPAWRSVRDRKSTRLNSSHLVISYAVFCLKKKKKNHIELQCAANRDHVSDVRTRS